jgi:hypothetical protein
VNGVELRRNEQFKLPAEHFIEAETEEFRRPEIEQDDFLLRIDADNPILSDIENIAKPGSRNTGRSVVFLRKIDSSLTVHQIDLSVLSIQAAGRVNAEHRDDVPAQVPAAGRDDNRRR